MENNMQSGQYAPRREAEAYRIEGFKRAHQRAKMVTDWPEGTPGLHTCAVRFAQTTDIATGGRIKVEGPAPSTNKRFRQFHAVCRL